MDTEPSYVSASGTRLAYFEIGVGEPVLFVHGSVSDHRFWAPQVRVLSAKYRCVAVDLSHFGRSLADPARRFGFATHAHELVESMSSLLNGAAHVVATSYGAGVALTGAVAEPSHFRSLYLHEPFLPSLVVETADRSVLGQARSELAEVMAALARGDQAGAAELFVDWTAVAGEFARLPREAQAMVMDNAQTVALQLATEPPSVTASQAAALAMPIQISMGEKTRPFFRVQAQALHRCLPNSRLSHLANVGHNAPLEDPPQFNAAVLAHLARHAAP